MRRSPPPPPCLFFQSTLHVTQVSRTSSPHRKPHPLSCWYLVTLKITSAAGIKRVITGSHRPCTPCGRRVRKRRGSTDISAVAQLELPGPAAPSWRGLCLGCRSYRGGRFAHRRRRRRAEFCGVFFDRLRRQTAGTAWRSGHADYQKFHIRRVTRVLNCLEWFHGVYRQISSTFQRFINSYWCHHNLSSGMFQTFCWRMCHQDFSWNYAPRCSQ